MAESQQYLKSDISKTSIPTNEEIIESLTSDLEKCLVTDETGQDCISDKVIENKVNSEVIDTVTLSEGKGSLSTIRNQEDYSPDEENDTSTTTPEDDLIDELAMKDRELTYSEEDKEVSFYYKMFIKECDYTQFFICT